MIDYPTVILISVLLAFTLGVLFLYRHTSPKSVQDVLIELSKENTEWLNKRFTVLEQNQKAMHTSIIHTLQLVMGEDESKVAEEITRMKGVTSIENPDEQDDYNEEQALMADKLRNQSYQQERWKD